MTLFSRITDNLQTDSYSVADNDCVIVAELSEVCIFRSQDHGWCYRLRKMQKMPCVTADPNYAQIVLHENCEQQRDSAARFLLRTAFECRFCFEGIVSLHAACVEKDGYAVAFTGPSGTGKSTRAKAWEEALGAEWISGDRPAVRIEKDGSTACGVPWDGKEQIFRDVERPMKAILEVRRSENGTYLRKLTGEQARKVLMQQTFVPMWDTDAAVMAMANVRRLIDKTPVYRVFCGPDGASAREVYDILFHHPERIREEAKDMKIKEGFVLRNVVDEFIVMPTGDNIAKFEGAVVLNEVAAFIFEKMKNPVSRDDLLTAMLNEFDVDEATAAADLDALIEKLTEMGLIED